MADAYWDQTLLLLPFDGLNNSIIFNDYSYTNQIITRTGTTKISTSASKFGGSSALFNGSSDTLNILGYIPNVFSQDWTMEFWFRPSVLSGYQYIINKGLGLQIYLSGTSLYASISTNNTSTYFYSAAVHSGTLTIDTWHYAAIVKSGTDYSAYVDVGSSGTATKQALITSALNIDAGHGPTYLGAYAGNSYYYSGYMDNVRITYGRALYSATFPTPTTSFTKTISGVVRDDNTVPSSRSIIAVPRSLPVRAFSTTSSASDGTWTLTVPDMEHTVICLDDTSGTVYNDLVYGRVTPV